jgi:hypothetical protein
MDELKKSKCYKSWIKAVAFFKLVFLFLHGVMAFQPLMCLFILFADDIFQTENFWALIGTYLLSLIIAYLFNLKRYTIGKFWWLTKKQDERDDDLTSYFHDLRCCKRKIVVVEENFSKVPSQNCLYSTDRKERDFTELPTRFAEGHAELNRPGTPFGVILSPTLETASPISVAKALGGHAHHDW